MLSRLLSGVTSFGRVHLPTSQHCPSYLRPGTQLCGTDTYSAAPPVQSSAPSSSSCEGHSRSRAVIARPSLRPSRCYRSSQSDKGGGPTQPEAAVDTSTSSSSSNPAGCSSSGGVGEGAPYANGNGTLSNNGVYSSSSNGNGVYSSSSSSNSLSNGKYSGGSLVSNGHGKYTGGSSGSGSSSSCPPRSTSSSGTGRMMSCFQGNSVADLQAWLAEGGVDISQYGLGTSKTVADLFEEASRKESVLGVEEGRALRVVKVLSLLIQNSSGQVLYEAEQILPDGRSRCRNVPLSEKLIGDERWQNAVDRAVMEELGTALPAAYQTTVFPETLLVSTEYSSSMSYPGLLTKYVFYRVSGKVGGLPEGPFETSEARPTGQLLTRWIWKELLQPTSEGCL